MILLKRAQKSFSSDIFAVMEADPEEPWLCCRKSLIKELLFLQEISAEFGPMIAIKIVSAKWF